MENMQTGLQLMIVGMATVFTILLIVIWGGKLLINVVNKIAPEEVESAKKAAASKQPAGVDPSTMAVLAEVVKQLTGGKGSISSAKKI